MINTRAALAVLISISISLLLSSIGAGCGAKCEKDSDCPRGTVCQAEACVTSCRSDRDCLGGRIRLGGTCSLDRDGAETGRSDSGTAERSAGELVAPDTAAGDGVPCAWATCPAGHMPDPSNWCRCKKAVKWCEACSRDEDCGPGALCAIGAGGSTSFCAEDCSASSACSDPALYACLILGSSRKGCVPLSGACPCLGVSCAAGKRCCDRDRACHECCTDADCKAPATCDTKTGTCKG